MSLCRACHAGVLICPAMAVTAIVVPAVVLVIVVPAVMLVIVMPTIMPFYMFWWPFPPSSCIVLYRLVSSYIVVHTAVLAVVSTLSLSEPPLRSSPGYRSLTTQL